MFLNNLISYFFSYDGSYPEFIQLNNIRPDDSRRYDERRKKCVEYLRERGLYLLDGVFIPSKATDTNVTIIFNRERVKIGEPLIQVVAK
jgi:hypothetical protein